MLNSFGVSEITEKDECEIIGTKGKISFSFFGGNTITITLNGEIQTINFDSLQHVQQPMLEKVVSYFAVEPTKTSQLRLRNCAQSSVVVESRYELGTLEARSCGFR